MRDASLFVPETISAALGTDLAAGLRALADALETRQLDGRFSKMTSAAGGHFDDRLHLRIVLDVAAPIVSDLETEASTKVFESQS